MYDFAVEGPVQAEVFVLWLDGNRIMLTGPCGPEAWYVELGSDDDPVEAVTRLARDNVGEPTVVHSTSWRRSRDAVVLSFVVVVGEEQARSLYSVPVERFDLARSEAASAPITVAHGQVLEHGLRHLAWLVSDDPVIARELADGWAKALDGYVPQPFRHLPL